MNEEAIEHYHTVRRLAYSTGDCTVLTEDVIDLALAVKFLFEQRYKGPPQHNEAGCSLAGNYCHLGCTP